MNIIDLRSDTVTRPSKAMREAMANAVVGDDVFGDDPTINNLQERCAELSGKEASLFVPSGCMANQLAIKSQTNPAEEIIVEAESHIINYEIAGPAFISGVQTLPVKGNKGVLDAETVRNSLRPGWYHYPKTSLICLENTHNRAGGTIYPLEDIKIVSELAREHKIRTHLDGARIFNAVVETGITLKEYATYFDSVSFCFSKGLGAPVGSILCSDKETIEKAHKFRKILGGGMRQAGILGAAALYALDNNIERLKEDHKKAWNFAEQISKKDSVEIDLSTVQTNIVIFKVKNAAKLVSDLKANRVLVAEGSPGYVRAVFHLDVTEEQANQAAVALKFQLRLNGG